MMYGYGHGDGWPVWAAALTWLGMIAVAGLVVWALYIAFASVSRRSPGRQSPDAADPGQILAGRLARGEIGPDEYQRLREGLASGRNQRPVDASRRA
jgi:putative membrane protein